MQVKLSSLCYKHNFQLIAIPSVPSLNLKNKKKATTKNFPLTYEHCRN